LVDVSKRKFSKDTVSFQKSEKGKNSVSLILVGAESPYSYGAFYLRRLDRMSFRLQGESDAGESTLINARKAISRTKKKETVRYEFALNKILEKGISHWGGGEDSILGGYMQTS